MKRFTCSYVNSKRFQVCRILLSAILIMDVCQLVAQVTAIDTVLSKNLEKNSWQYQMEQANEGWSGIARHKDYQLFHKFTLINKFKMQNDLAEISFYGDATLFWLNNVNEVEVAAAGITRDNADEFIYHVTVNDSTEIIPWSKPSNFQSNKNISYAYLGKFNTQNKVVKLELYNTKNYSDKITWVLNGLYMPPAVVNLITLGYINRYLFKPDMQQYAPYNKSHYFSRDVAHADPISFNWSDSINNLAIMMKNSLQNDMYNVYLKRTIKEITDTVYISNNWTISYYSKNPTLYINSSYFNKAGKYQVIVVPEAPDEFKINSMDKAVVIPFTVLPAISKSFTAIQVMMITGLVVLIGTILFLLYYFFNKRRAIKELQQKEMAVVQLKSVRSQLNPHFMFNALAGIQNLMNKGDINATNLYLSKFSRITRNVLDDKNKDGITIKDEINLLEDYLQMEQMRFGFNYNIYVDDEIDMVNTEIPSMLLQPYIENAVKHGVSPLKQAGVIAIAILLKSGSLVMEVRDNGNGYDTKTKNPGNGTILSEKRADLINQINKRNLVRIAKESSVNGTIISIELNNWI